MKTNMDLKKKTEKEGYQQEQLFLKKTTIQNRPCTSFDPKETLLVRWSSLVLHLKYLPLNRHHYNHTQNLVRSFEI